MINKTNHRAPHETPRKGVVIEPEALPGDPPAYQEIAVLAYSYWEARGYQGGSQGEDWLCAEADLRKRHTQMRTPKEPRAAAKSAGA